jgi:acyl-CoA synthetase (AMP-forming)/AMP-acid ligase II
VRSPAVRRGYWGGPLTGAGVAGLVLDERATAAVLRPGGWLAMGDFGALDKAGNLCLAGREHDRYLRGGYNVYPAEVEAALATLDGLAEAAVVGVPDPVLGEVGVAFVVVEDRSAPPPEPDALLGFVRAGLAPLVADYKVPDRVVVVDALPLTSMSKLDRQALRRWAEHGPPGGAPPGHAPPTGPPGGAPPGHAPPTAPRRAPGAGTVGTKAAGRRPVTTTRS